MKIAIVKPIPPRQPITSTPLKRTPGGSAHQPSRTASHAVVTMPSGLPTTRPDRDRAHERAQRGIIEVDAAEPDPGVREREQRHHSKRDPRMQQTLDAHRGRRFVRAPQNASA